MNIELVKVTTVTKWTCYSFWCHCNLQCANSKMFVNLED